MDLDALTAGVVFFSFAVFLVGHLITFRQVRAESLLKSLLMFEVVLLVCPLVLMGLFYKLNATGAPPGVWICAAVLAAFMQGLMCFVYLLCIFGPYETSVRMRLVREIAGYGEDGISKSELLGRYNAETIVNKRLRRLVGSGDLAEKNGRYRVVSRGNFFFIFDAIAGVLKKWIGR